MLIVIGAILLAGCTSGPASGENLLSNPGFEEPWNGDKYAIPSWNWWGAHDSDLFEGVFDSTWHSPAEQPGWPTNYGPFGGSQYLAQWYGPQPIYPAGGGKFGGVRQTIEGLTVGTNYYAQCWFATHHPHGGGAGLRLGLDPSFVDPEPQQAGTPSANTVWSPPIDLGVDKFAYSEAAYSKLNVGPVAVDASGRMTVWLQYIMTSNNVSQPQIVQVDDVRLATTKSLEIRNILIIGLSDTMAKVVFDTYDGGDLLATNGFVDYGLTTAYGTTKADGSNPRANHEIVVLSLVKDQTYHFRCRAQASDYEEAASADITFVMKKSLSIANVQVTDVTGSTATIEWDTIDPVTMGPAAADSRVEYGYTSSDFKFSVYDATPVSHHVITLTGLEGNTKYYYRVSSDAAEYNPNRYPSPPTTVYFITDPGDFWNGDFETVLDPNRTPNSEIPGWTRMVGYGFMQWFPNGEWSIPSHGGGLYVGSVANYGLNPAVLYQRFRTTPGEVLSYGAWVWAQSYGQGNPCAGFPHRFGETSAIIGIDPTGGAVLTSENIVWSSFRQTQNWREWSAGDPCVGNAVWQRIAVSTVAQSDVATIFLRAYPWYGIAWNMMCFDDVSVEPVQNVTSVGDLKTRPNDVPISLQPADADCPVVTYVANPNYDSADNNGLPYFYIEDRDRKAGIKVTMAPGAEWPATLDVGKTVRLKGNLTWGKMANRLYPNADLDQQLRLDKPAGERAVRATEVTVVGDATIQPLAMINKGVAGGSSSDAWFTNPGAYGAIGENTVGLLVKVWGRILEAGPDDFGYYMVIDDGSAVPGFSGSPAEPGKIGLYVRANDDYSADVGKYALITGISAVRLDYDWDDPTANPPVSMPESMLNVRCVKAREVEILAN